MAADALERHSLSDLAKEKALSCGITQKVVNLKDAALARKIGRERGVYVTFDCAASVLSSERGIKALQGYIANTVSELFGILGRRATVLAVGLGNDEILADSLGCRAVRLLKVSDASEASRSGARPRLCAFAAGVEGVTGIKTAETVEGVCARLKPSAVIVIDSLATASAARLGTSFQITSAGIAPASGVGGDKARIDKNTLGVPVVAVGVPLVLSMRTILKTFSDDYTAAVGCEGNEYKMRELMAEKKLSGLVVAPKEIKYYVESAANIVAGAVNRIYGR